MPEGQIATPETVDEWLKKYELKSVREMMENTPGGLKAEYDPASKILTIFPALPTEAEIMKPVDFKTGCFGMRGDIELVKSKVVNWLSHPELLAEPFDAKTPMNKRQEMAANLTLAYRHLEDARMRLGKAVQAYDGGKSCYPR